MSSIHENPAGRAVMCHDQHKEVGTGRWKSRVLSKMFIAVVVLMAVPLTAHADYRTDNSWMTTTNAAVGQLHGKSQWFSGPQTRYHKYSIGFTSCKGDLSRDFVRDSNGHYHHLFCAAKLVGLSGWGVGFQFWQVGESNGSYRTSNVYFFALH